MAGLKSRDYDNGHRPGDSPGIAPACLNAGRSPGINRNIPVEISPVVHENGPVHTCIIPDIRILESMIR